MALRKTATPKKPRRPSTLIQSSRRVSAEEKAIYHQVEGAGRSHVVRPFLGLTESEEDAITARLTEAIDRQVQR